MALRLRRGTNAQRQTITPVEGEIIFTTDTKQLFVGDGTTVGGNSVSAPVTSVNGQTGTVSLTSNEISEGNGNLYFTNERAQDATSTMLTGGSHTGIGFTYVDNGNSAGTINAALSDSYVTEVAQDAVKALLDNGTVTNINYTYDDTANSLSLYADVNSFGTITVDPGVFITQFTSGTGYRRHPLVTLTRGVGDTTGEFTNGLICAYLIPNALETIQIVNGGTGYLSAPTITVVPDPYEEVEVTATATCTVSGGVINSVTITAEGNYSRSPTIVVTPTNGGSGAVLRALLYSTNVSRFSIKTPGFGWTVAPNVVVTTDTGDSPSVVATATAAVARVLESSSATDELRLIAGSDKITVLTSETQGKKRVTFDIRNTGEVAGAAQYALPFYGKSGNTLVGARGLNWIQDQGTLQVGSNVQNMDGTIRVIRNVFNINNFQIASEQYHENSNSNTISLVRARGTQTAPAIVQSNDKLGSFTFSGYDGVRFVGSAQIAGRAVGTIVSGSNKLQTDLEFFTSNGSEAQASRGLVLAGLDKKATFYGPIHVHRMTTAQRDALTGLGANTVGYMIYNTTTNKFQGYQNTGGTTLEWVDLS